jgi:putative ABC transport system ATP-binding protein
LEIGELLRGGMAAILLESGRSLLFTSVSRSNFDAIAYQDQAVHTVQLSRRELDQLLARSDVSVLAVKPLQDCDSISANPVFAQTRQLKVDEHHDYHDHISPLSRFFGLLRMERKDISLVAIFAFASSVLSLSTPLAVESLVNVISWGVYVQPLIVLAVILLVSLVLSGMFSVLQNVVVEIVQRRQFVRIVCDLAHRFPVSNRQQLKAEHPRELANRVLDIMTIQKATAVLLLDGTNIVIVSFVGLILLGFYHAYLLSFVIVLLISMTLIVWLLGRGGVSTAIEESKTKYRMVHWLQDVLDSPTAFRINGGDLLAINRASSIATEYVEARKKHFQVLLRQIIFAAGLQAIALTSVLGIGGWLVMQGDLTLGQLVAAELVVALVVGSFSKAGKSIEKFYDLMASIDKVGHLLDIKADSNTALDLIGDGPLPLDWSDVEFDCGITKMSVPAGSIEPGTLTAILIAEPLPKVAETLAGLLPPLNGSIKVSHIDVAALSVAVHQGRQLSLAARAEIFYGSIASNIDMGRSFVSLTAVRETIKKVNLWQDISALPTGINTILQSTGYPLTPVQMSKLMMARSLVASPRLLIVDGLLDSMNPGDQQHLLELFQSLKSHCSVVLITRHTAIADKCDYSIDWRQA